MVDVTAALAARLDACDERYALHFAGQPRLTADPDMLAALQAEAADIAVTAGRYDAAPTQAAASARARRFGAEHAEVLAARAAAGEAKLAAAPLLRRAALCMHRYARHFAGQPRPSRDLGLLQETAAELAALAAAAASADPTLFGALAAPRAMLADEATAIAAARAAGTPRQQAAAWAAAANNLLSTYATTCIGRRRLACRPGLWARLGAGLGACEEAMAALARAGLDLPHHGEAMAQVARQRAQWREEEAALVAAHREAQPTARQEALDAELDDILAGLNAADPPARDALRALCDRADEVAIQLAGLGTAEAGASARVATDALALLCGRFDEAPPPRTVSHA